MIYDAEQSLTEPVVLEVGFAFLLSEIRSLTERCPYQQLMKRDPGLDVLLELTGTEYTEENGYWYKIET